MRLVIVSDIHANLEALRATLAKIDADGADRILCLGDVVGYHSDPGPCIDLLRNAGALCVAGNHDWAVAGRITTQGFSGTAARSVAWTRQQLTSEELRFLAELPPDLCVEGRLVAVHGALLPGGGCVETRLDTTERRCATVAALLMHPSGARICAFGHTHELGIHQLRDGVLRTEQADLVRLQEDAQYLVNPGTIGQPRTAELRATYLVLDLQRRILAVRRVPYDMASALAKARKAGLLPPLRGRARARSAAARTLRWMGGLHGLLEHTLRRR